jgi:hypothetical protein
MVHGGMVAIQGTHVIADQGHIMHGIVNIEPEVGIGKPLGFGEAGIKDPLSLAHSVLTEFDHGNAWFATTPDELFDRDFQV